MLSNADALANPRVGPAEVRDLCPVDDAGRSLLRAAMQQRPGGTRMSARAYHRNLKLARTIADLVGRLPSGKTPNKRRPVLGVTRTLRAAVCIYVGMFLAGCGASVPTPAISSSPMVQTPLPAVVNTEAVSTPTTAAVKTEAVLTPTATAAEVGQEPPTSSNAGELLKSAVANLQSAASFQLAAHVVRAYRVIEPSGETKMVVYGEFNTDYAVMRLPTLRVHATHEDRYDPQDDFVQYESFTYQENGKYFTRFIDGSMASHVEETDLQHIRPMAGDVYQTLVTYSGQAKLVTESDGVAVYVLEHPEWYRLEGAVGFADLGFLRLQENAEPLIKEYAAEHYPNVKPIRFTIYVAIDEQVITKVLVDDHDFMVSVWAEVDRALIERGEKPENLTRYEVMSANGAEYLFSNYDQVPIQLVPAP